MNNPLILISGATGNTGSEAIDQLLDRQARVRALVRSDDQRAAALRSRGVQVVIGDLRDFASVKAAMEGVSAAYFVFPLEPGILKATAYFAQAAKEANVKAIVNISQRTARFDAVSEDARDHWFSERVFDWCGVPVTHLRPVLFMEWLVYPFQLAYFTSHRSIRLPGGKGRHSPIAAFDQGRVIATILTDPAAHAGKTYHLYGPDEMSYEEMAQAVGEAIGLDVRYEAELMESFVERITAAGVEPFRVQHLAAVFDDFQRNLLAGANDTVKTLTGAPPMSIREFARKNVDLLRSNAAGFAPL